MQTTTTTTTTAAAPHETGAARRARNKQERKLATGTARKKAPRRGAGSDAPPRWGNPAPPPPTPLSTLVGCVGAGLPRGAAQRGLALGPRAAPADAPDAADAAFLAGLEVHRDAALSGDDVLPRTQNIVAKVVFDGQLSPHHLAASSFNIELNPANFAAAIMRQTRFNATSLIFRDGTMICVGTSNSEVARLACQHTRLELRRLGYAARFVNFRVVNRVMNYELGFRLRVADFYADHEGEAAYDPDLFPGCTLELADLGVVALLFDSGKVIVMGFRQTQTGYDAVARLRAMLTPYRTNESALPSAERYDRRVADKARTLRARDERKRAAAFAQEMHDAFGVELPARGADADAIEAARILLERRRGAGARATVVLRDSAAITAELVEHSLFAVPPSAAATAAGAGGGGGCTATTQHGAGAADTVQEPARKRVPQLVYAQTR